MLQWIRFGIALAVLVFAAAPVAAEARVTREELQAFVRGLEPLMQEGAALRQEMDALQARLETAKERRAAMTPVERMAFDLETFRELNRRMARLEGLVVKAEALRPADGLREPHLAMLLAVQHSVVALRNTEAFALTRLPAYKQVAAGHVLRAAVAEKRFKTRMDEISREVGQ